jgi:hypothetical protein
MATKNKTIGVEQRFELLARLGANTNWDMLDPSGIQALIDKPGGPAREFTEFLRNGGKVKYELKAFPTWKTIKLGTGLKKADDFRKAIKAAGMKISDCANDILGKPAFTASETEQEVDLVVATPKELGFNGNATYRDICNKAIELGFELCPAEVGPQLRKQYTDQPKDEWLVVAMEPITVSHGYLDVFRVGHDGAGLWLGANLGGPDDVWRADDRFVFVRRK